MRSRCHAVAPCRTSGERLLVGDPVGHRPGQPRRGDHLLARTRRREQPDHPRSAVRRRADELRARDQRQRLLGEVAVLRLVGVGVVDAGRGDLVQLLAVPGHGVGQVDDVQDLGAAEFGDLHGSHEQQARASGLRGAVSRFEPCGPTAHTVQSSEPSGARREQAARWCAVEQCRSEKTALPCLHHETGRPP